MAEIFPDDSIEAPRELIMNGVPHGESPARYAKLYTMLLNAIPSSVLLVGRDMRIISVNRNFVEKSQRSIANTIGERLEEVFPPVILDNLAIQRRIEEVFRNNRAISGERMTYRAPGFPIRTYYYSILPFSWGETVESAMLLLNDVTEQIQLGKEVRRIERHLASIVESASDMVLSMDTAGRILTWNTAAEKISGYLFHEIKDGFFFEYCASEHQEEVKTFLADMMAHKQSSMTEWDLVTMSGDLIPISWVFSPMRDDQGQTVGIVALGRDLTERRKFEMELRQSQKLAALGVMAGGIAHEIRNPLAICWSAVQFLMSDDVSPGFQRECVQKIHTGIQKTSMIIENLLRFAHPSASRDLTRINLIALIDDTLGLVANQARIQKIELRSDVPKTPVLINGNASLLQQAFMNLFMNAINAMPDGGSLSVCLEQVGVEVLIRIVDTGCGISSTDIDRIFDPFYTTSAPGKGTGLGLSICYSIIKRHFGSIEVESAKGAGSTFLIRLPLT